MLLVNKGGVIVDTPDDMGEEFLQGPDGFRLATADEHEIYAKQVAKSHPRYLARVEARRKELEEIKNRELDDLYDKQIEQDIENDAAAALDAYRGVTPNAGGTKPLEIKAIDPDALDLDDTDIPEQVSEAQADGAVPVPDYASKSEQRRVDAQKAAPRRRKR